LQAIITVPQNAPEDAITRSESALSMLERIKRLNKEWIKPGHRRGSNMHNVSATVSIKQGEWSIVGEWLYENKDYFTALSFLPQDLGTYVQAPFETITEDRFNELYSTLSDIDLTKVVELVDTTARQDELACASGNCEIQ
jgi:ribonucleoside-diphosphate reductase alpha chain